MDVFTVFFVFSELFVGVIDVCCDGWIGQHEFHEHGSYGFRKHGVIGTSVCEKKRLCVLS